jgi:NAD(P)-dependent dehydrogenase (short-subunit alcohol dehydrogenase family)
VQERRDLGEARRPHGAVTGGLSDAGRATVELFVAESANVVALDARAESRDDRFAGEAVAERFDGCTCSQSPEGSPCASRSRN